MGVNKMGRKRISKHLKRQPCTVSLPLDIHLHLDKVSHHQTVSKYIEYLIRKDIRGKQASLLNHKHICKKCGYVVINEINEKEHSRYLCYQCDSSTWTYQGLTDNEKNDWRSFKPDEKGGEEE